MGRVDGPGPGTGTKMKAEIVVVTEFDLEKAIRGTAPL